MRRITHTKHERTFTYLHYFDNDEIQRNKLARKIPPTAESCFQRAEMLALFFCAARNSSIVVYCPVDVCIAHTAHQPEPKIRITIHFECD